MIILNYLLAVFCSPLYFLIQKRYVAFIVHAVGYFIAFITFFAFFFGIFVWLALTAYAVMDLVNRARKAHILEQAKANAAEMQKAQTPAA